MNLACSTNSKAGSVARARKESREIGYSECDRKLIFLFKQVILISGGRANWVSNGREVEIPHRKQFP